MEKFSISELYLILNFLDIKTLGELRAMHGEMKRKRKETTETQDILPLEMIEEGNAFDPCQKILVSIGAYDLILIENASEIAKEDLLFPNLEKIMGAITKEFGGTIYLPSNVFDVDTSSDSPILTNVDKVNIYASKHKKYIEKNKVIFTILALNLGEEGAHYGGFIFNRLEDILYIYDSMSKYKGPTESAYASVFEKIGEIIFNPKITLLNTCLNLKLQPTGGFLGNLDLERLIKLNKKYKNKELEKQNVGSLLILQIPESQDHFCFMWSLWLILFKLQGFDSKDIKTPISLLIIKKFIWTLIEYLKLNGFQSLERERIFKTYFPTAWLQPSAAEILSIDFNPSTIEMPAKPLSSIKECFLYSVEATPLYTLSKTKAPKSVEEAMEKITETCLS